MKTCLSILLHHLPQYIHIKHTHLIDTEATALYAAIRHLVMTKAIHQIAAHSVEEQNFLHQHSNMVHHHAPTAGTDDPFQDITAEEEEDFPTTSLDDDIWLEDPVPDRHLCIHKQSQPHFLCSYPCWYSLNLPPPVPEDTTALYYKMMDHNDISDFQDVMTITSDEDIPDLDDVLDFEHGIWFG